KIKIEIPCASLTAKPKKRLKRLRNKPPAKRNRLLHFFGMESANGRAPFFIVFDLGNLFQVKRGMKLSPCCNHFSISWDKLPRCALTSDTFLLLISDRGLLPS